jgi:hypothetical protein
MGHLAVGLGVGVAVAIGVGLWQKMSWLKLSSESRMSALRRRCALMEGLICFFIVVVLGGLDFDELVFDLLHRVQAKFLRFLRRLFFTTAAFAWLRLAKEEAKIHAEEKCIYRKWNPSEWFPY